MPHWKLTRNSTPSPNEATKLALVKKTCLGIASVFVILAPLPVEDGSTDGTRDVLDTYGSRINSLYQQNRGASAARNLGVLATNCEWVAFLDHDDEWYPTRLACQAASVVESGAEFCYTVTNVLPTDDLRND